MNATYLGTEFLRVLRTPSAVFFSIILPMFFYIIFGASQSFSDMNIGRGNVAMAIMITMAGYGAVVATVGMGATAATERIHGWGRQLGLTPMSDGHYIGIKSLVAVAFGACVLAGVYVLGAATKAQAEWQAWLQSFLILLAGSVIFALYGLLISLLVKSEAAVGAASGSVVILAFMGNVFFPLSGTLLTIAKFTPMYGYISLAKRPVTEGWIQQGTSGDVVFEPLWVPLLNMGCWAVILGVLATWAVSRSRERL